MFGDVQTKLVRVAAAALLLHGVALTTPSAERSNDERDYRDITSESLGLHCGLTAETTIKHILAAYSRYSLGTNLPLDEISSHFEIGLRGHAPKNWGWARGLFLAFAYNWEEVIIFDLDQIDEYAFSLRGPTATLGYRW